MMGKLIRNENNAKRRRLLLPLPLPPLFCRCCSYLHCRRINNQSFFFSLFNSMASLTKGKYRTVSIHLMNLRFALNFFYCNSHNATDFMRLRWSFAVRLPFTQKYLSTKKNNFGSLDTFIQTVDSWNTFVACDVKHTVLAAKLKCRRDSLPTTRCIVQNTHCGCVCCCVCATKRLNRIVLSAYIKRHTLWLE